MTEGRRQRTEDRGQITEGRGQMKAQPLAAEGTKLMEIETNEHRIRLSGGSNIEY